MFRVQAALDSPSDVVHDGLWSCSGTLGVSLAVLGPLAVTKQVATTYVFASFFLVARRQEKRRERKKAVAEEEEAEAEGCAEEDKAEGERGQRTECCTKLVALVRRVRSSNGHVSKKSSFEPRRPDRVHPRRSWEAFGGSGAAFGRVWGAPGRPLGRSRAAFGEPRGGSRASLGQLEEQPDIGST